MLSLSEARECIETAAADLERLDYEELESFARSHDMFHQWQSREVQVGGEKVYVNTMMGKLGWIHKRISVELSLSAEGDIVPADTPFLYFERYKSGRFYPSPREEAREASLAKALPYALPSVAVLGLLIVIWYVFLRDG